jgi:hypothetical protein
MPSVSGGRFGLGVFCALVVSVGWTASASAATRFAVASGGLTSGDCTEVGVGNGACTIGRAFVQSGGGDTVSIGPGTYPLGAAIDVTHPLTITASDSNGARPELDQAFVPLKLDTGSNGTTVSHLAFVMSGTGGSGIQIVENATLTDDTIMTSGECVSFFGPTQAVSFSADTFTQTAGGTGYDCVGPTDGGSISLSDSTISSPASVAVVLEKGTVTDSTITGSLPALAISGTQAVARRDRVSGSAAGVVLAGGGLITDSIVTADTGVAIQATGTGTAENVTAVGTGPGSVGAQSVALAPPNITAGDLTLRNSIARGDGDDLQALPGQTPCLTPPCPPGAIHADHSDYATTFGTIDASGGGDVTADPRFAGPTDYHLMRGSPAIDGGTAAASTGTTDLDGKARIVGPAPDMGAYEFQGGSPLVVTGAPTDVTATSATLHGTVDPGDSATTTRFDYGTSTAYGSDTAAASLNAVSGAQPVSVTITGLEPNHTYHARLTAANGFAGAPGTDVTFTTPGAVTAKLSRVAFKPARFHVTGKHKAATHIHFTLSETATVRVTFARHRVLTLGKLKKGKHAIAFSGHVGRQVLRPGRQAARLVATVAGAKPSKPAKARFTVLRSH